MPSRASSRSRRRPSPKRVVKKAVRTAVLLERSERLFLTATDEEIAGGAVTDVYFTRALQVLSAKRVVKPVAAEVAVKHLPNDWPWGVLAGVEECARLLARLDRRLNVWAMPEGTLFRAEEPVMVIDGIYNDFGLYETAVLGLLCQASGIATKAARCKRAAGDRSIISFGARRAHPALAPMIERNAYIGGCDGVAVVASARRLGIEPVGTMPHALILLLGDSVEAARAFDEVVDRHVRRVVLVDTFSDEKVEALRVAKVLGKRLYGVRLDTPASRRGDFLRILQEVRWELDLRGFEHVKLFASGGIDEEAIRQLNPAVDAYGVGTAISSAPVIDFALDLIEIEGKPVAKRGKSSGRKQVWRCPKCLVSRVAPWGRDPGRLCQCSGRPESILQPLIVDGRLAITLPGPHQIRERVLEQLRRIELSV